MLKAHRFAVLQSARGPHQNSSCSAQFRGHRSAGGGFRVQSGAQRRLHPDGNQPAFWFTSKNFRGPNPPPPPIDGLQSMVRLTVLRIRAKFWARFALSGACARLTRSVPIRARPRVRGAPVRVNPPPMRPSRKRSARLHRRNSAHHNSCDFPAFQKVGGFYAVFSRSPAHSVPPAHDCRCHR